MNLLKVTSTLKDLPDFLLYLTKLLKSKLAPTGPLCTQGNIFFGTKFRKVNIMFESKVSES